MYCVIQKVVNKQPNPFGAYKELLANEITATYDSEIRTKYGYAYGNERFIRPIMDAYKISIHQSYREDGKVCKKQWTICTMGYYELLDSPPDDHIRTQQLKDKLKGMGISEKQLWEMVYAKLDPLVASVKEEFETTEEFQTEQKHKKQLKAWRMRKTLFEKSHGIDAYEFCYDFFNTSKNYQYENELRKAFEKKKEEQKQQEERKNSNYNDNHDYSKYSNYFTKPSSNYTDKEKVLLKKFYRCLARSFHPDISGDDGLAMTLINEFKEGWGI
ncbi:MAG: hypothetical protein K6T85_07745 [Gorillibacterium sp.]|nr:hypothetical protein [Gorillibacterium sp.]